MPNQQSVTPQFLVEKLATPSSNAACSWMTRPLLAAFAREELGRCELLGDQYNKVIEGETVTLRQIKRLCAAQ